MIDGKCFANNEWATKITTNIDDYFLAVADIRRR